MSTTTADLFHAHLDECQQCREHPFSLCRLGAALLAGTAVVPNVSLHPLATAVLDAVEARERTPRHTADSWPATIAVANAAHAWRDAGFPREAPSSNPTKE